MALIDTIFEIKPVFAHFIKIIQCMAAPKPFLPCSIKYEHDLLYNLSLPVVRNLELESENK